MRMNVTDEQGWQWTAVAHGEVVQQNDGPVNIGIDRSIMIALNGTQTRCYLGSPLNETRANFKDGDTWWHITQCDQSKDRDGRKPNFYSIIEAMVNGKS